MTEHTGMGSNIQAQYGSELSERLAADYRALLETVDSNIAAADWLPKAVTDKSDVAVVSDYAIRLRDLKGRIEQIRIAEKEPHLRSGTIIDAFFKSLIDRVEPIRKKLVGRVDDYKQEQLRIEKLEREVEARKAREREAEARRAREAAEKEAREIEQRLARARSKAKIDEHEKAAEEAELAHELAK